MTALLFAESAVLDFEEWWMPRQPRGQQKLFEKKLFYGDNLDILRAHFTPESVDLIYLDPPFKPDEKYNVLFRDEGDKDRVPSASQVRAFDDTWRWGSAARTAFNDVKENSPHHVRETVEALHAILGFSNMFAYLAMMAPRLVELHRVLKPTGSIYLHCDSAANRYLGVLMDAVFGPENFQNELIWKRTSAHGSAKRWGPIHDDLLFYTKGKEHTWNQVFLPLPEGTASQWYNNVEEGTGRRYNRADLTAPGIRSGSSGMPWRGIDPTSTKRHWAIPRWVGDTVKGLDTQDALDALDATGRIHWPKRKGGKPMLKRYLDESSGIPPQDVITDIYINNIAAERLGYPTQKPEALLQRIIEVSSNEGDVVLDPFCGCGTSIDAAETLGRNWLGIDIAFEAIPIIRERLIKHGLQDGVDYEVEGAPTTLADAEKLAKEDKYRFQWWAVRRLGGKETDNIRKKGSDKGVDGRLTLITDTKGQFPQAIISVKGGATGPAHVRELAGTIKAQKADIGVLVVLKPPTRGMTEAADAEGGYPGRGGEFCPRIQILTAEEIIKGVGVKAPASLAAEKPTSRVRSRAKR